MRVVSDQEQHETRLRDGYQLSHLNQLLQICQEGTDNPAIVQTLPDAIVAGIFEAAQVALFRAMLGRAGA